MRPRSAAAKKKPARTDGVCAFPQQAKAQGQVFTCPCAFPSCAERAGQSAAPGPPAPVPGARRYGPVCRHRAPVPAPAAPSFPRLVRQGNAGPCAGHASGFPPGIRQRGAKVQLRPVLQHPLIDLAVFRLRPKHHTAGRKAARFLPLVHAYPERVLKKHGKRRPRLLHPSLPPFRKSLQGTDDPGGKVTDRACTPRADYRPRRVFISAVLLYCALRHCTRTVHSSARQTGNSTPVSSSSGSCTMASSLIYRSMAGPQTLYSG